MKPSDVDREDSVTLEAVDELEDDFSKAAKNSCRKLEPVQVTNDEQNRSDVSSEHTSEPKSVRMTV